jgi:hypothetical protein
MQSLKIDDLMQINGAIRQMSSGDSQSPAQRDVDFDFPVKS